MAPGAEQGDATLTEKLKGKLGKAHGDLEALHVVGPHAETKIAETARAFVAKMRSGVPMTYHEVSLAVDQLCADVLAHEPQPAPVPAEPQAP